ncbi:hypothetical protein B0H66DRAFT_565581 [Apodospora peruviana]|uniref:DnaJ homologue subfamily C member 28 conserved domain-containing protein n=1 Tax=Apodospora peruviana TaxID=516989 RepID=A0AAE0HZU7_9PEZI|nr:hypothetical protein B0H66DRAFT_565581 [Apodospora peruviana]
MASAPFICGRCARALRQTSRRPLGLLPLSRRYLSRSTPSSLPANASAATAPPSEHSNTNHDARSESPPSPSSPEHPPRPPDGSLPPEPSEQGPMARRLEEATEEALLSGGRAGKRAIEDAGFSEELKTKLLKKLADAKFEAEHAAAFAEAGVSGRVPGSAGQGTRAIASAEAWTGEESQEDAILRMLDDAKQQLRPGLRGKPKIPTPRIVDMRIKREPVISAGRRVASAREKAQAYAGSGLKEAESGLTEEEREAVKREFRERFSPGARAMPITVSGLAALANERIEDAIARGQFKNIPRGKGVERDARADNPFIDTTEYIMNKMIKRQDIVPPWIEKQQELLKAASSFRLRLRTDWKRHASRMIASRGGSLQEQMSRAAAYARAEEIHNPRRRNVDQIAVPSNSTDDAVMTKIRQLRQQADAEKKERLTEEEEPLKEMEQAQEPLPSVRPFRDPDWEAHERSYMELAVQNLNAITRSYNLMAPELAKKPYFSLERELKSCFADVAPQLADVIKERASAGPAKSITAGGAFRQSSGVLERLGGSSVKVYESTAPKYGFRDFWKDLWVKKGEKG